MINGILNIYKPQEYTSFDCVAILRRQLSVKKVGHTGTLDPMATGVLACCVGRATRIIEYLEGDTKEYRGTLKLGMTTDTCDIWGDVTSCQDVVIADADSESVLAPGKRPTAVLSRADVLQAFSAYLGEIEQTPPLYAAVKVDGKKLYEYAREGRKVEVRPRRVTIHELDIESVGEDTVDFRMVCGRGTYVRSLCRDIGEALGVGGTMMALERTRTGMCEAADSLPIEAVKEMDAYDLASRLIPMEEALARYPKMELPDTEVKRFLDGQKLKGPRAIEDGGQEASLEPADRTDDAPYEAPHLVRVYGREFLGMGCYDGRAQLLTPDKILAER